MAQTKKKRRRKHRGTQGGKVDTRPKGRPRNRAEAKQRAQARRAGGSGKRTRAAAPAGPKPPTWPSAIGKGVAAGAIFLALLVLAFGRPLSEALPLAGFMLAFYIPMSFLFDRFFYNRQLSKLLAERRKQQQDD
jgi:hypothetical protein